MNSGPEVEIIDRVLATSLLPQRVETAHKWGVGGVVIVGGAPGYLGAPALAAMGAARSGAGIVSLAVPRSSVCATAALVPEAVFLPLAETDSNHGIGKAIESIAEQAAKSKALIIGPGLSRDEMAGALLEQLFGDSDRATGRTMGFGARALERQQPEKKAIVGADYPSVIDADALHWLSSRESWWTNIAPGSLVLTPHAGEMAALRACEPGEILADPPAAVRAAALEWRQTVVLKAGKAYVSDGHTVRTVEKAAPALATAGTGDVLAGSIGAFLAQGLAPVDAATLAVYAGVEAALRLSQELSTLGVVASDLPEAIAHVLADLEAERGKRYERG